MPGTTSYSFFSHRPLAPVGGMGFPAEAKDGEFWQEGLSLAGGLQAPQTACDPEGVSHTVHSTDPTDPTDPEGVSHTVHSTDPTDPTDPEGMSHTVHSTDLPDPQGMITHPANLLDHLWL
jgi:hypothetical protein